MPTIHVNEVLPASTRLKRIRTGSELLFVYELNKYTKKFLGKALSLSDVAITKDLLKSTYFSFVVSEGLEVEVPYQKEDLADYSATSRYFFTKTVEDVDFVKVTEDRVTYAFEYNIAANAVLHGEDRSAAYVSLMAYLVVKAHMEGKNVPVLHIDHKFYNQTELEYVDLDVLRFYGNKLLAGFVDIEYGNSWNQQPEWEAFVIYHRQLGLMNREYTTTEKSRYLRKNFEVGDVVLIYQRKKSPKGKTISILKSCFPAVIRNITDYGVDLEYYPDVETRQTRAMKMGSSTDDNSGNMLGSFYTYDDYDRFNRIKDSFDFTSIGIGTCSFTESRFFIKPIDEDGSHQWLQTPNGHERVFLSTLDAIYAVFKDQEVQFNEEKFLDEYFRKDNRIPKYTQYMQAVNDVQ